MPDSPQNDDPFSDLFRSLPTASPRRATEPAVPAASAPVSRRAAREAARAEAAESAGAPAVGSGPASAPARPAAPEPHRAPAPSPEQPLDALFAKEGADDDRARQARHHRDRRKSRIAGWVVLGVVLALLGGIAAGGFWVWNTYEQPIRAFMGWEEPKDYEAGLATGEASVTIVSGDNGSTISQSLHDAGVTKTATAFYDYLISTGQNPTFMPGVYALQEKMTSAAALEALEDPANKQENTAQLREGLTVSESLQRVSEGVGIPLEELQAAVKKPSDYGVAADSLEGWLFPATYTFDPGVSAKQVVKTLVDRTISSLDDAGVPKSDRQRVLTIASIIQREARFEDDFYKVSRVIENRLDKGNDETHGYLQMDSTAQYGYGEMHDGTVSSSAAALKDDNPWNTYVHPGLPKGPIANPGDVAIKAAMEPAKGPWLYFVTVDLDTGETVFSATYAEHQKAVAQWQAWCAANDSDDC